MQTTVELRLYRWQYVVDYDNVIYNYITCILSLSMNNDYYSELETSMFN